MTVTLPNKEEYTIDQQVVGMPLKIQQLQQKIDLYVLPMDMKIILGNQWLSTTNPLIDWRNRTMKIEDQGEVHEIQMDQRVRKEGKRKVNFMFMEPKKLELENEDMIYLINRKEDTQDELGIDDEFYA